MADYRYETLIVDQQDNILTITLNRPERLKAVNDAMHEELPESFRSRRTGPRGERGGADRRG